MSWLLQNDMFNVLVIIVFPIKQAMMSFAIFRCFDDNVLLWLWWRWWFYCEKKGALSNHFETLSAITMKIENQPKYGT